MEMKAEFCMIKYMQIFEHSLIIDELLSVVKTTYALHLKKLIMQSSLYSDFVSQRRQDINAYEPQIMTVYCKLNMRCN